MLFSYCEPEISLCDISEEVWLDKHEIHINQAINQLIQLTNQAHEWSNLKDQNLVLNSCLPSSASSYFEQINQHC